MSKLFRFKGVTYEVRKQPGTGKLQYRRCLRWEDVQTTIAEDKRPNGFKLELARSANKIGQSA